MKPVSPLLERGDVSDTGEDETALWMPDSGPQTSGLSVYFSMSAMLTRWIDACIPPNSSLVVTPMTWPGLQSPVALVESGDGGCDQRSFALE